MTLFSKLNFRLRKLKAVRESVANREYQTSGFIPYKTHWNKNTVLTKHSELIQIIKVNGFSFETADSERLDICKVLRNLLFKSLGNGDVSLYFHLIRRKQKIYP